MDVPLTPVDGFVEHARRGGRCPIGMTPSRDGDSTYKLWERSIVMVSQRPASVFAIMPDGVGFLRLTGQPRPHTGNRCG
jgi:hypothetical protein